MGGTGFPLPGFEDLLNAISSGVCVYSVKPPGTSGADYIIRYFNEYALKHEGMTLDQVAGKSLKDLRSTIDDYGLIEVFRRVWETGEPGFYPASEYTDGKYDNWYENRVFRLHSDMIVAVYDDVTERVKTEETLRSYTRNAPLGFFIADPGGRYIDANPEAERITGYTKHEILTMSISDMIPPEHRDEALKHFQKVVSEGVSLGEVPFQRKDGTRGVWNVRAASLPGNRFMAFVQDISEKYSARENLARNQARYKQAEIIGKVGSWEYDLETGEFWGSEGARRMYGFDSDKTAFTTEEVESRIPERERVHQALLDLIEKGSPYDLEFEVRPLDSQGSRTIHSVAELIRDSHGKPVKVTGMVRDVTTRAEAQSALRESEEKYRSLFENMRDGMIITDNRRHLIQCNRSFLEMFRCTREFALSGSIRRFYPDNEEFQKVGDFLKAIAAEKGEPFITASLMRADGTVFTGEISLFARKTGGGELLGYTGSIRDISRRMLLEEQVRQSQKMEAIGQLAGGIAHDFNNLLTIINGYAYMLLADIPDDDRRRGELEEIRKAGHRAASLTRQLLAFSRKQVLQPEAIDINTRIRDTESMLRRLIGEHILLETRLCPEKLVVMADPGQFDQIIINLAVNARDAMPRGGRLSIETQPVEIGLDEASDKGLDSYGSYALIRVSDNGCGIPPENVPHVFEPFFTTKGTGEGTGMGLPTVFGILKQSKGDISVESSPGSGSVFTVILPRVDAPESRREESSDAAGRKSAGEVILLVEDEESVRELIRSSLELGGFTVMEAENGRAALGILRSMEKPPDLLLTDVMMPEMSGRELAQGLRKLFPETPVCFMSGYTDETIERLELLESGASFIQKPFLPGELIEMVRRVIDGSRA